MDDTPVERLNAPSGWVKEMGIVILAASPDEVTCVWEVGKKYLQPYGIVHGGVHRGVIESLASIGAALVAQPRGGRAWSVWRTARRSFARCAPEGCTVSPVR